MTTYKMRLIGFCCFLASSSIFAANHEQPIGQTIYERACKTCHAPELATGLGAPRAFNKKDWAPRLQKAQSMAKQQPQQYPSRERYLLEHVKMGRGLMHHGGLCKEQADLDCSDDALLQAIAYISNPKK